MEIPETRYARSGDLNIAYQVVGEGPIDLVYVPGFVSNVELAWEDPSFAAFLRGLAAFARVIVFDKRGTGLSDRVPVHDLPTLEERMDDLRAVMDAAGSARAALFGHSEGGAMAILFAATYPERTAALITYGAFPKRQRSADYPWAPTAEDRARDAVVVEREWGRPAARDVEYYAPSKRDDPLFAQWLTTYLRRSASPGAAAAIFRMNTEIDVRHVLPAIRVPTLVIHAVGDRDVQVEEGRFLASKIPGAKYLRPRV
jgi:pimeloyl-ACP methyl ester carboxylesterase